MEKKRKEQIVKDIVRVIKSLHHVATGYPKNNFRDVATLEVIAFNSIRERYNNPLKLAAYFMREIAIKNPFWDGNKRTAFITAMHIITTFNGRGETFFGRFKDRLERYFKRKDEKVVRFVRETAERKHSYKKVLNFLKKEFGK